MISVERAAERFHTKIDWLDSRHTFSFAEHYDPKRMGFRALRVINEDHVKPGHGFPMHPHEDMEIVTYVLEGALRHEDSMGNGSVIRPGEVQRMSAGTGVFHSEINASDREPVHLLQIWIRPERRRLKPGYEQKATELEAQPGRLRLIAGSGGDGAVLLHQDAEIHAGRLGAGDEVVHALRPGRHAWVQVARGEVELKGEALSSGDGAALSGEREVRLRAVSPSEVLVFDLA